MAIVGDKSSFALEIQVAIPDSLKEYGFRRIWLNGIPLIKDTEIAYLPTFNLGITNLKKKVNDSALWNEWLLR